jgi:hypothetical protein
MHYFTHFIKLGKKRVSLANDRNVKKVFQKTINKSLINSTIAKINSQDL